MNLGEEQRSARQAKATKCALHAFFGALASEYSEAETGDSDPIESERFTKAAEAFVAHWVELNAPTVIDVTWVEDGDVRARVRPNQDGTYFVEFAPTDDHGGIIGRWEIAKDGEIRSNGFGTLDAALAYVAMVKAGADLYSAVETVKKMCVPRENP